MSALLPLAARDVACLSCRQKSCCAHYIVCLTGADVWRIMSALQVSPGDFLRYWERDEEAPGRFLLKPGGPFCDLVLAKREVPPPLPAPCVFLMRTNDGHGVCGLGELRPGQCQTYPLYQRGDLIHLINDPKGCVRTWSTADVDFERERPRLRALAAEEDDYARAVADWNHRVVEQQSERSFVEYCSYLVNHRAEASPS